MHFAQELDINTLLGIHFLQDQMASYEVEPDIFEKVSLTLVTDIRSRMKDANLEDEPADETEVQNSNRSVGDEAEQGI